MKELGEGERNDEERVQGGSILGRRYRMKKKKAVEATPPKKLWGQCQMLHCIMHKTKSNSRQVRGFSIYNF